MIRSGHHSDVQSFQDAQHIVIAVTDRLQDLNEIRIPLANKLSQNNCGKRGINPRSCSKGKYTLEF